MEEMSNVYINQASGSPQGEDQKKSGGPVRIFIPVAVFVVLVLILVGVAAATGMFSDRKKIVTEALSRTFSESTDAIGKVWQMDEYYGIFADGQYGVDANFDIGNFLQFEMQINAGEDAYSAFVDIGYFGGSLLQADLYADEKELLFAMPYYMDDYVFYVDRESLNEDIQNLVRDGMLDDETADYLKSLNDGSRNVDFQDEELKQGLKEVAEDMRKIFRSMEVEKVEGKSLEIDGRQKNCKGYVMTLTGRHMADYFLNIKEVYEKNEAFRNYCNESAALGAGFGSVEEMLSYYDPARLLEECAQELERQEPVEIYFYIDKKTLAQVYTEFGDGYFVEWNVYGGNFPLENTEFMISDGTDEVAFTRRGSMAGDSYQAEYELKMADQDMIITLSYDKGRGDFELNAGFDDGFYLTTLLLEGDIDRSKELAISIDNFEIDEEEILAGDIVIFDKSGEIKKPEGQKLDVMKMSEEEWEEILQEIYNNM